MAVDNRYEEVWVKPVVRIGMVTMLLAVVLSFGPLAYLYIVHGILPDWPTALKAWGLVAATFGAFYVVEPVSYYPMLGLAGTYISFLTGNIGNLRVPCAVMAQEVVGVEEGTRKGEIVGTMGICGSVVVNLIGVTLAAFIGTWLISILPEVVADAFRIYTAPAIFGAVFGQFIMREPKLAPFAFGIPVTLIYFNAPAWLAIIGAVFGTMAIGRVMYKKKMIG